MPDFSHYVQIKNKACFYYHGDLTPDVTKEFLRFQQAATQLFPDLNLFLTTSPTNHQDFLWTCVIASPQEFWGHLGTSPQ